MLLFFLLARWFPSSRAKTRESAGSKHTSSPEDVLDVRHYLLDLRKQKELAEGVGIEEDDAEDLGKTALCLYGDATVIFACSVGFILL